MAAGKTLDGCEAHPNVSLKGLCLFGFLSMPFLSCSTLAATDYSVRDAHLTSDVGSGSAFDSSHGSYWSDKQVPTDDKTYYIPGNRYATVSGACHGKWVYVLGIIYASGSEASWTELRMGPGGRYRWWSQVGISGRIVIEGTESNPSLFSKGHPNGFAEVAMSADFASDEPSSCMRFDMTGTAAAGVALPDYTWLMTGDWSDYYGTVVIGTESSLEWRGANASVPGTVQVEGGGYFTIGMNAFSVGALAMDDNSILRVRSLNRGEGTVPVAIENALQLGDVKVVVDGASYAPGLNVSIPLFRLGAAAVAHGFDLSGLVQDDSGFRTGPLPSQVEFRVEDDTEVAGGKVVRLVIGDNGADIYTMNVQNVSGEAGSAFTAGNEGYWVGSRVPQQDSTGFLLALKSICWTGDNAFFYTNMTLVASAGYIYMQCAELGFDSIHLTGDAKLTSYEGSAVKDVHGDLFVDVDTRYLVYADKTVNLHCALHGDRDFVISTPTPHLRPIGFMGLYGDNRDFHGAVSVTAKSDDRDPSTTNWNDYRYPLTWKSRYFTLTITNETALGGAYVGDAAWKSFHVNCAALVKVLDDVRFVEPTRGMFVDGEGQIYVATGKRFAIGVPLTMGGTLSKSGPGVLELGGEARFIDGDPATEPLAGTNVLSVAGPLKIASVDAVNGMSITIKNDASLRMDLHPQGAGMMETGFKTTRWATPFTVNTDDGRIPVVFDDGAPSIDDSIAEYRLPICTVAAAAADGVHFALPKIDGRKLVMEKRLNADGSVTVVATYVRRGFRLSVR
ncbi:MAG: hypothetical protein IKE55_10305 [Kiritimatiellae bacterium]|nr:hypothetical protein [Kiritimatiellia bacterium]